MTSGFTLLETHAIGAKKYTLKDANVKKVHKNGDNCIKIVIWGGKSSVLWSRIAFYGLLARRRKTKFPTIKPTIYLPKRQF